MNALLQMCLKETEEEEVLEEGASLPSRSRSRRQSGSPGTPASPSSALLLLPPPRDRPRRRWRTSLEC